MEIEIFIQTFSIEKIQTDFGWEKMPRAGFDWNFNSFMDEYEKKLLFHWNSYGSSIAWTIPSTWNESTSMRWQQ